MNNDYVYPNVFMSNEDTEQVSNLQADLQTYMERILMRSKHPDTSA